MTTLYIGLGSNIHSESNLRAAAKMLRERFPDIIFSAVYRTAPQERADQEDFLNAVAKIETEERPEVILRILEEIENTLGKSPPFRFGPRTIDLDILLYGQEKIPNSQFSILNSQFSIPNSKLVIPHPRMESRRFVLEPLRELAPDDITVPFFGKTLTELLEQTYAQGCEKIPIVL